MFLVLTTVVWFYVALYEEYVKEGGSNGEGFENKENNTLLFVAEFEEQNCFTTID